VFFSAWWRRQSPAVQADVARLVAAGQLDFINGGWVQHDEAAAHYAAMIDQTTRGHRCAAVLCGVFWLVLCVFGAVWCCLVVLSGAVCGVAASSTRDSTAPVCC
jgi:hypothetical protein